MTLEPNDPELSAEEAGLRYVSDAMPGVRRRRAGKGFSYIGPDGARIADPDRVAWIRSLAIPPAWTDVWICPDPSRAPPGHRPRRARTEAVPLPPALARGPRRGEVRAADRVRPRAARGSAAATDRDLRRRGLPREKVLALVVRLLETTLIRVGNDEYARENRCYGLTTLRDRHVEVRGATMRFRFRGKGGKEHDIDVRDERLARIVRQVPGPSGPGPLPISRCRRRAARTSPRAT